jgi:hypothetical protein
LLTAFPDGTPVLRVTLDQAIGRIGSATQSGWSRQDNSAMPVINDDAVPY